MLWTQLSDETITINLLTDIPVTTKCMKNPPKKSLLALKKPNGKYLHNHGKKITKKRRRNGLTLNTGATKKLTGLGCRSLIDHRWSTYFLINSINLDSSVTLHP